MQQSNPFKLIWTCLNTGITFRLDFLSIVWGFVLRVFRFLIAMLLICGCQTPETQDSTSTAENPVRGVENSRSLQEVDAAISKLLKDEDAQTNIEALLNGWGQYGDWYDLTVVKFLSEHWPGLRSDAYVDPKLLIPIIQARIRSKPELNRQVYWYAQWKHGPLPFPELCRQVHPSYYSFVDGSVAGEEFQRIMYIAGLTNEPNKILDASWDDLYLHWHLGAYQFLVLRPFLRYDKNLGLYVVDDEAREANRYLDASVQEPTLRETPLPNWSSPIIPKSPKRN